MATKAFASILLIFFVAGLSNTSSGQYNGVNVTWKWVKLIGGDTTDLAVDLAPDATDNFYAIGSFINNINILGQVLSMPGKNNYLVKLDSTGTKKWAMGFPGSVLKISIDPHNSNNIVVGGVFSNSITIGGTNLNSAGGQDCFAFKLDSLGNIGWVTKWGGNGTDDLTDLEYQVDGNINVIGYFKSNVVFFPDNISINKVHDSSQGPAIVAQNLYSAKLLDATGKTRWAAAKGITGTYLRTDISTDMRGNIILSYWNLGSNSYSAFKYDSTFLVTEHIGTDYSFTRPGGGNTTEYHNLVGGNSRIDKFGNIFYDRAWEYFDTFGQCIGCREAEEATDVINANSDLVIDRAGGGCSQCTIIPPFTFGIGVRNGSMIESHNHMEVRTTGTPTSDPGYWQLGLSGATDKNSLLTESFNKIYSTGKPTNGGFVGPTYQATFGREDVYLASVQLIPLPLKADAGIDRTVCTGSNGVYLGGSPTAEGGAGLPYTYSWSPATGLDNINKAYPLAKPLVNTEYVLTITDRLGQIKRDTVNVFVGQIQASITPSGSAIQCTNDSLALTANPGRSYLWSNGKTARRIFATSAGTYSVAVTDDCGNTTTSPAVVVTQASPPPIPAVTASGPLNFCAGGSVTVTGPPGYTYEWIQTLPLTSTPIGVIGTNQSVTITQGGRYYLKVYNTSGCSSLSTFIDVSVYPVTANPTITAAGPTTFCQGGNVSLTAPSGFNYLWSTGSTARTITVNASGSYTVTITSTNGCGTPQTAPAVPVTVLTRPPAPVISTSGPAVFCNPGQVTLSAPPGYSEYRWIRANSTDTLSFNQSITLDSTIWVALQVVSANGCASPHNSIQVVESTPLTGPINLTTNKPPIICSNDNVNISAPYGLGHSYLWNTGSTQLAISTNTAGSYFVVVSNGCNSITSSTVNVTVNPAPPSVITASGPTTICFGDPLTLTAPAGLHYVYYWSTPSGGNAPTTQSISNIDASGIYRVTVRDTSTGCYTIPSPQVSITVNSIPYTPTITASGPTSFCQGGSVTLTGYAFPGTGNTYLWNTGATTPAINVTTPGTYTVSAINSYGCRRTSLPTIVTVNPLPTPVITANGPTTFCAGGSVGLSAPAGFNYLWSTGATTQTIFVAASGNYSVTVTSASGCSATSAVTSVTVNALPATPSITASGPTTFCQGGSVTLTAPAGFNYLWSTAAPTQSININSSGVYSVTVTNANNCSASSVPTVVTVNPTPAIPVISASGPTTFCQGGSVTLTAPAGFTYLWNTGATTQNINVSGSGNYSVTVRNANNCGASSSTTTVVVNALPPAPAINSSGPTSFCQGGSVTLSAPAGFTYLWSTGATTQSINVNVSGNYSVTVTNANGCSTTSTPAPVTVHPLPPVPAISANGPTTFCQGGSVTLSAPAGFTYLWSTGATTQTISVTTSGNYSVSVTNANGCSSTSAPTPVTVNPLPPVPTITQNGNTLTSSAASGNQWYFNGTLIAGATAQTYTYTTGGNYTVTVTNPAGCSSTSAVFSALMNGTITIGANERFYFTLFPNPVTTQLQIEYEIEQQHVVGIALFNMNGRRIPIQNPITRSAGRYTVNANAVAERLWTGMYILEFTVDGQRVTRTIIKF